ncbi:class I SAM-dependent methyltransferase [Haliangium sp.]|uniref:class I SAM-dependent methyltransferase n=1 Tax=Haliangium sp. TaxID=2663208 RepID=UPI003D10AECE
MLDSLFVGSAAGAIDDALAAAGVDGGPVAVVGPLRLGRALAERGREVVQIVARPYKRGGAIARQVQAAPGALPLDDDSLRAVVAIEAGQRPDWDALLAEWRRVLADRGALVLIDRAAPIDMTRRALCGGLADIEQRRSGRKVVTSGRIIKL